uniref:NR LBD domain-containing protein n=1 Tax=Meloidogyne hapla TaxID=6305 RepID=A0A1I8BUB8_MELHA
MGCYLCKKKFSNRALHCQRCSKYYHMTCLENYLDDKCPKKDCPGQVNCFVTVQVKGALKRSKTVEAKQSNEPPNKKTKMDAFVETEEQNLVFLVEKLEEAEIAINGAFESRESGAPNEDKKEEKVEVNYCIRHQEVTQEEISLCVNRMLTKVFDYINHVSLINFNDEKEESTSKCKNSSFGEALSVQDKIVLLKYGFAPLFLFECAAETVWFNKNEQNCFCLPTGITFFDGQEIVPNNFITKHIISKCISSLVQLLDDMEMDQEEFILMKLIILMGMDSASGDDNYSGTLSVGGKRFIENLKDVAHSALYSLMQQNSSGTKLFHILPRLALISRDLIENIRMVHGFAGISSRPTDPLFVDLFGDIFQSDKKQ